MTPRLFHRTHLYAWRTGPLAGREHPAGSAYWYQIHVMWIMIARPDPRG
jgi:hypothetical protein